MTLENQLSFDFGHDDGYVPSVLSAEPQAGTASPAVAGNQPLEYTLKVSARARQVIFRVVPGRGLTVTIPKRYPKRTIPAMVEEQREWIQQALDDLHAKTPEPYRHWPPAELHLHATGEVVELEYAQLKSGDPARPVWLGATQLRLHVDSGDREMVAGCIASALKTRAQGVLGPWLAHRARAAALQYKRLSIRGQRTLWGSFSSSGTLSLNYKLLFLPPDLVDYVILHELAHTRHLDHSASFWKLLEQLKPGAGELDSMMNAAGDHVPPWLELVGAS